MRVQSATANSHHLSADLFEAAAMKAVEKDLLAMKVGELKDELEVRGEGRTGNKAWLVVAPAPACGDCAMCASTWELELSFYVLPTECARL